MCGEWCKTQLISVWRTGTCNATEVQTVGLQDNSPQTWVKGFAYTLTATSDHSTGEFRVATTGLSSITPAFDLVNGTATATFRLGDGDLAGQTGALVLLPAPGAFALSPKYLLSLTFADSGLLSSDNTIHDGIKLPLALDFNNTGELSVSISPRGLVCAVCRMACVVCRVRPCGWLTRHGRQGDGQG